ncbi:hypothetical protein ACN077_17695 [Clostridium chromiireducens]|uniref:hypothetical protein n=1 Tax=Clostridium chromiireducens TaxID=225345 RepID=UPI003AF999AC
MKIVMKLKTRELFKNGVLGIVWIIVGATKFFEMNIYLKLILALILFTASILVFIPYFVKSEKEDEMSKLNQNKAKSIICDLLTLGIMICSLVAFYKDGWMVDLKLVLPFIMGSVLLSNYLLFIFYERVGN